jgi:coronin-1B/1C/6
MQEVLVKYRSLGEDSRRPEKATDISAGYDLFSANDVRLTPEKGFTKVELQLSLAIPQGFYGQIASRSGLAYRSNVVAFPGVIDADYRGPVSVLLRVIREEIFLEKHTRIAQLLILPHARATFQEEHCLPRTRRGQGGFGSTGLKEVSGVHFAAPSGDLPKD